MKNAGSFDPPRWRESPSGADATGDAGRDARAGALAREVPEPVLPGPAAMAALGARIDLRRGPRPRARRILVGVAAAALLIFGAVVGAAAHSWLSERRSRRATAEVTVQARPAARMHGRGPRPRDPAVAVQQDEAPGAPSPPPGEALGEAPTVQPVAVPAHTVEASSPSPTIAGSAPARPRAQTSPPTAAPPSRWSGALAPAPPREAAPAIAPAPESAFTKESRALGLALARLRRGNDARGALAALAEYDGDFPRGRLRSEAGLVRVEALLALGERTEALRWLDADALDGPRARELLVLRGELRAAAGRCPEAVKDLGRGLSPTPTDALDARALYARASCFTRLHQFEAAHADLTARKTIVRPSPSSTEHDL